MKIKFGQNDSSIYFKKTKQKQHIDKGKFSAESIQ